jgi:hypothetical protein
VAEPPARPISFFIDTAATTEIYTRRDQAHNIICANVTTATRLRTRAELPVSVIVPLPE